MPQPYLGLRSINEVPVMQAFRKPASSIAGPSPANASLQRLQAAAGRRARIVLLVTGVIGMLAAYELTQYALGACQGFSGAAAFERSIVGNYLGLWSVDPQSCR
jgi:hypothetical protein